MSSLQREVHVGQHESFSFCFSHLRVIVHVYLTGRSIINIIHVHVVETKYASCTCTSYPCITDIRIYMYIHVHTYMHCYSSEFGDLISLHASAIIHPQAATHCRPYASVFTHTTKIFHSLYMYLYEHRSIRLNSTKRKFQSIHSTWNYNPEPTQVLGRYKCKTVFTSISVMLQMKSHHTCRSNKCLASRSTCMTTQIVTLNWKTLLVSFSSH